MLEWIPVDLFVDRTPLFQKFLVVTFGWDINGTDLAVATTDVSFPAYLETLLFPFSMFNYAFNCNRLTIFEGEEGPPGPNGW